MLAVDYGHPPYRETEVTGVATYEFRCAEHGVITVAVPMTEVTGTIPCPTCGAAARRLFSAPQLALGDSTARRIIDATRRSADQPQVVTAPVGQPLSARRRRPLADPRTAKLPKP